MFILKYSSFYLYICLCNDKVKLEQVKKAALISQHNELLREDYMKLINRLKHIHDKGELVLNDLVSEKLHIYLNEEKIKALAVTSSITQNIDA